jgi:hypothetical protein
MSKALGEIVVSGPHHPVCQRDLEHRHHLILPIVQFVYRSFFRRKVFECSQPCPLLPTIALALRMLSITGLVGSPLLSLVLLDLGLCHGFRFTSGLHDSSDAEQEEGATQPAPVPCP